MQKQLLLLGNVVPHLHWPIWGKDYTDVGSSDDEYRKIVEEIRAPFHEWGIKSRI